jgi:Flp pilus assembly CpaE family ATPase
MTDTTVSIPVDATTAQAYNEASTEDRRKIQLLLHLRMRELLSSSSSSLSQLMDEIGAQAEARGLTPEILENLLSDE